jgi:Holliday junction resolvasome RuvABC DNA-binding subunit
MPRRIDAHAKVFSALRHLGFRESEVKTVLSELRADAELGEASVEYLLHEALYRIRPAARVRARATADQR